MSVHDTNIRSQYHYANTIDVSAKSFLNGLHEYGGIYDLFSDDIPRSWAVLGASYRAVPDPGANTSWHATNEWLYVLSATIDEFACHLGFRLNRHQEPESYQQSCACKTPRGVLCAHVKHLGRHLMDCSRARMLPYDGIHERISSPMPVAQKLSVPFLKKQAAQFAGKSKTTIAFKGSAVGLQVLPTAANAAVPAGLALVPVLLNSPGRKRTCAATALPDLSTVDVAGSGVPDGEKAWLRLILSMTGLPNALHYRRIRHALDLQAFEELCAAGRVISSTGLKLKVLAAPLASILRWQPLTDTTQKLMLDMPAGCEWLSEPDGVVFNGGRGEVLFLGLARSQIEQMAKWPALSIEDAREAHAFWTDSPVFRALPPPLKMDDLPIRQASASWRASVILNKHPTSDWQSEFRLTFMQVLDGVVADADRDADKLVKGKDEWVRYSIDTQPLQISQKRLRDMGFKAQPNGVLTISSSGLGRVELASGFVRAALDPAIELVGDLPAARIVGTGLVHVPQTSIRIDPHATRSGLFVLSIDATVGEEPVDLAKAIADMKNMRYEIQDRRFEGGVLRVLREGVFAYVDDGSWGPFLKTADALLAAAKKQGKQLVLTRGAVLAIARDGFELPEGIAAVKQAQQDIQSLLSVQASAGPIHVEGVAECTYAPFQATGVAWLTKLRQLGCGGVLADDRGLGKTLMSLGAIAHHRSLQKAQGLECGPSIVIMERKEIETWKRELRNHMGSLNTHWEHGATRLREAALLAEKDIVLTTYNTLLLAPELFRSLQPEFVILDEAKAVKNVTSKRWETAASFEASSIIPVTGTPLDRNLNDVYALVDLAVPGLLGSQYQFRSRFGSLIGRDDPEAMAELKVIRETIAPFVRRVLKEDVGDQLPKKEQIVQPITMDDAQAKDYDAIRARLEEEKDAIFASLPWYQARFKVKATIEKLRKWCAKVGTKAKPTNKGDYLVSMTQQLLEAKHRVLIFSHFNQTALEISERLNSAGIGTAVYVGDNANKRDREMLMFKQGHFDVMVSGVWGSSGLDLPEADCVIINDSWINQSEDDQMGDRAHRFISTSKVTVFKLALANTIEDEAVAIIDRARASGEALFRDTGKALQSIDLSRADYDRMFSVSPLQA